MLFINTTNNLTNSYPLWYFLNDFLIINLNIIGIFTVIIFISTVIRLEYPSYTISNLIACKTCLAIGFMSLSILLNNIYVLASDFRGIGYIDSFCIVRGTISSILFIIMYTSLCLKAFNRLRCIVYRIRSVTKSYKSLLIFTLIQWILVAILVLPILLTNGVEYDWGSHLCLVTLNKTWQFFYLMSIYYISVIFISSVYLYILYYVVHLSLLERYRRKRQFALLRRIVILLVMLILPGIFYLILIIFWMIFNFIPFYSFKILTLVESIGHTGAVITIFISNSRVRRHFYKKKKILKQSQRFNKIVGENYNLILLKPFKRKNFELFNYH